VAPAPAASAALPALNVEPYLVATHAWGNADLAAILRRLTVAHQKGETMPTLKSTAAAVLPLAQAVGGMDPTSPGWRRHTPACRRTSGTASGLITRGRC
jgi:hypothetical protein